MSLFHYTDINAVCSILRNRKLWLTDLSFLNDKDELHEGIGKFIHAVKNPIHGLFADRAYDKQSVEYLQGGLSDTVNFGLAEAPIFICSFSRAENLLSQWRGYGLYAIEFDEELLLSHVKDLKQCVYEPVRKTSITTGAITAALTEISKDMGARNGCISTTSMDALADVVTLAATFKNEGFVEEQEVRVITQSDDEKYPLKYRAKGNLLIPYIEVDISLDCVRAVHIGPINEQDLAFKSLSSFARGIEREWQIESGNIEYWLQVKTSKIPYRSI